MIKTKTLFISSRGVGAETKEQWLADELYAIWLDKIAQDYDGASKALIRNALILIAKDRDAVNALIDTMRASPDKPDNAGGPPNG